MREPQLLRWMLPGAVMGWGGAQHLTPEVSWGAAFSLVVLAGLMLLKFTDVRRSVFGAVLMGCAVGVGAQACGPRVATEPSADPVAISRFELIQPWTSRGNVQRWLAHDRAGHPVLLETGVEGFGVGNTFVAGVRRLPFSVPAFPGDFDEKSFLKSRGVTAKFSVVWCGVVGHAASPFAHVRRFLAVSKDKVVQRCLGTENGRAGGFVLALTTGDKRGVSQPTRTAFSDVGLSHLVAVSGFHIGLVSGLILLVLRALSCPRSWRPFVFLPLVWAYVGLCGWPGSAVRAASMASLVAWAVVKGRKADGLTVLSGVGLAMVAFKPASLGDLGVGLSFLATAGILLLHRCLSAYGWSGRARTVCMLVGVPIVATACTAPLSWPAFGKLPVCFLASNVMATPLVTLTLVLFAVWFALPQSYAVWAEGGLVQVVGLFLDLVNMGSRCAPLLLPLDRTMTTCAGAALALGVFWGLAVKRPVWFGWAGVLTACAVLRWSSYVEHNPQQWMVGSDCVVFSKGRTAVFSDAPPPQSGFRLKWKTRSFTERVSKDPPDSIRWCGTQWAMSPYHIRCRTVEGAWHLVNSSR